MFRYNENDWNDIATLQYGTYAYSKVQAEKAGIEWLANQEQKPFELSTIHFPFAFGPQQSDRVTSSNQVLKTLLCNEFPVVIPLELNVIDIRKLSCVVRFAYVSLFFLVPFNIILVSGDVARAHIHVLEHGLASGRYIVALDPEISSISLPEIARVFRKIFPDQ